jgi:hypothetical protein
MLARSSSSHLAYFSLHRLHVLAVAAKESHRLPLALHFAAQLFD